jgi:hypothetical protein
MDRAVGKPTKGRVRGAWVWWCGVNKGLSSDSHHHTYILPHCLLCWRFFLDCMTIRYIATLLSVRVWAFWIVTANTIWIRNCLQHSSKGMAQSDRHNWMLGIRTVSLQPPTSAALTIIHVQLTDPSLVSEFLINTPIVSIFILSACSGKPDGDKLFRNPQDEVVHPAYLHNLQSIHYS